MIGAEVGGAEPGRRGDDQLAARRLILARGHPFRLAKFAKHPAAGDEELLADFGQGDLARAARQKLGAEMRFELGHLAADGRQRHAQAPGSGREPALLRDGGKRRDGLEPVHSVFPLAEIMVPDFTGY